MIWIDFYGSLYIPIENFKNFHPFSPLLGHVDLHFGLEKGQKSTIKNGVLSISGPFRSENESLQAQGRVKMDGTSQNCLKIWIDFYGSLYIPTDNFNNFHPFSSFHGPVDLHVGLEKGQKSTIFTKMAGEGRWFWFGMIWIDCYGTSYISTDQSKNFHPFPRFLGPVDLHFEPEKGQKSTINKKWRLKVDNLD